MGGRRSRSGNVTALPIVEDVALAHAGLKLHMGRAPNAMARSKLVPVNTPDQVQDFKAMVLRDLDKLDGFAYYAGRDGSKGVRLVYTAKEEGFRGSPYGRKSSSNPVVYCIAALFLVFAILAFVWSQ